MTRHKAFSIAVASTAIALTLGACSDTMNESSMMQESEAMTEMDGNTHEGMDMGDGSSKEMGMDGGTHDGMNHSGSGDVPEGMQPSTAPAFDVGSSVIVEADHMAGMQGVEATVSGAYDTVVYSISYTPEGGDPVKNHKWVVHEELDAPGDAQLEPGTEVVVNADHMEGMAGETVTIETAEETTVYTIDYVTSSGEKVVNHMWVTGEELSIQ